MTHVEDRPESEICPSGVGKGYYEEMPGYPVTFGNRFGHNYGPCLRDAPLGDQRAYVKGEEPAPQVHGKNLVLQSLGYHQEVLDL